MTIEELHRIAVENEEYTYTDPATGRKVCTSFFLIKRDYCCNSDCRHCPYLPGEKDKKPLPIIDEVAE